MHSQYLVWTKDINSSITHRNREQSCTKEFVNDHRDPHESFAWMDSAAERNIEMGDLWSIRNVRLERASC